MEKYDNLGMVGEGSYGMVMKCKHKETGQIVAIKKFLESEDDKMVKKIAMREVRMLRKLRHENLVNLIEVFRRRKRLYLVFEFVDHTVLDDLEKYPNGLSEMTVRKILWQVLRGVEFCHSHNIIHRDIKPENILNSRSGVIKICDFGFARSLAAHGEIYTDYVATRWYRAPELLVGDTKYGRPVDLWAVGCLVAEMLTGDPLFPGDSDIDQIYHIVKCFGNLSPRHREIFQRNPLFAGMRLPEVKEVDPLEKKFPKYSPEVIDLMKQCLRLDPNDRPSSSSLLRHEFFKKDNFEEKVIPEIRARIQKEYQQNQMVRKSLAEKQQQKREEDAENRKKKRKENTSGAKDQPLATPPTHANTGVKLQEINKDSPRNDTKNLPNKKDSNVDGPRKPSLASLNAPNKTPPSDEKRKSKDTEKDRKLPPTIKQDNTMVTGATKTPPQAHKLQPSKDDFSTPRTLIPKVTNESMTRDALKNIPLEVSTSPAKDKSPREPKPEVSEKKQVKIVSDLDSERKGGIKIPKTPPPIRDKSPKQPKASILKNPSQTGLRGSKEGMSFDSPTLKGSFEGVAEKRGNIKPDQDMLPLTKSISDTTAIRDKRSNVQEKLSTSTPTTPAESTAQAKPSKQERSPKKPELSPSKSQKDTVLERKDQPTSSKQPSYHIPPIQSQTGPAQSLKIGQNEMESSVDAVKQFPSQGIRVVEKTKKVSPTKDSFSPQTSYEKSMYGSTVSNFEKMMLSMSGATAISHPAIKKSNQTTNHTGGTSISPYSQSQSPYAQQFGIHYSRDENKPTGSNLPLWSTNPQSYFDKSHRTQDGKGTESDRKHKTDDKSHHHHHHHRHHHKHEDKSSDDKQGKYYSKVHDDKLSTFDSKRTRLPDLMGRGAGGGMSTSRADDFPGFKQTGNEYQKRSKPKVQKQVLMAIPGLESSSKQLNSTSANDTQNESNFPSVRRKL